MKLNKSIPVLTNIFSYVYNYRVKGLSIIDIKKYVINSGYFKKYGIINAILLFIYLKKGNSLFNKKKYAEAEIIFSKAKEKWPDNILLFKQQAKMTKYMNQLESACRLWKEITIRFPDDEQSHFNYIKSLIAVNKIDTAYEFYKNEQTKFSNELFSMAMAYIYIARYDWDSALNVLMSLPGYDKSYISIRIKEAEVWYESNKENGLEHGIEVLEALYKNFPGNYFLNITLAKFYIFAFRQIDARRLINELYDKYKYKSDVLILYAWSRHSIGNENQANQIWNTLIEKDLIKKPALYMYKGSLDRIDINPLPEKPDKILLFTCIKNELHRLPWFLEYYRKLGIDCFFIVDNGSNDGSTAFLRKQKDVHLFWTEYNYGQAGAGMQWINKLINIYGKEHWCIYLDVDEALIFPGMEKRSLKYLINYMNRKGHEVFRTFMLDMYPYNTKTIFEKSIGDPFEQNPYFDNNYQFFGSHICPYIEVKGGVRNNIFGERVSLTKTPIIAGNKEIKFLMSSHQTSPAIVSDVTGVLLHYKLMSDLREKSLEDFSQKNRMYFCNQRHLNYKNILDKLGDDHILVNPLTVRYESSDQLVKLGLMTRPDDFD